MLFESSTKVLIRHLHAILRPYEGSMSALSKSLLRHEDRRVNEPPQNSSNAHPYEGPLNKGFWGGEGVL